jgi:hypothetical protein
MKLTPVIGTGNVMERRNVQKFNAQEADQLDGITLNKASLFAATG